MTRTLYLRPDTCESCTQHPGARTVYFEQIDNGNGDIWPAVAFLLCTECAEFADSLRGITARDTSPAQ